MTVSVPSTALYRTPELMGEQVDELLYGDEVEITDELGGFYRVRTDYGYEGWAVKPAFFEKLHDPAFRVIVPFADLLFDGRNYYHSPITLPLGSRIDFGYGDDERYGFVVLPSKRIYYIHREHVALIADAKKTEDEKREAVCDTAMQYLGVQYRWGGRTPAGVDCSGLCFNAYRFNGLEIWRDADPEKTPGLKRFPLEEARRGDLLFFEGHMALYLGGGKFIHASASAGKVVLGEIENSKPLFERFVTAGTVL